MAAIVYIDGFNFYYRCAREWNLRWFLTHEKVLPLARPEPGGPRTCRVVKTEEKGSDVNLATQLLLDAFRRRCDAAFVISIDSDLLEPIRVIRSPEFGVRVGLGRPRNRTSWALTMNVDLVRKINPGMMRRSVFPDTLTDAHGTFSKPPNW